MDRRDVLLLALAAAGSVRRDADRRGSHPRDADRRGFLLGDADGRGSHPPRSRPVRAQTTSAHTSAVRPAALAAGDGELVHIARDPVRIKLSPGGASGRFAIITQEVSPGTAIPVHLHENEDELIVIQSGSGEATLADATVTLTAGSILFVPHGTWHGGRNTGSATLMWIAIYSPSGFEGYFREIGRKSPGDPPRSRTPAEREALDRRYGIRYQQ